MAGTEKRQRQHRITVRFTESEMSELAARADKAGLSVSGYFRSAALEAPPPRQSRRPPIDKEHLARLLAEIGRIGGNVNQLARIANAGSWPEEAAVYEAQTDIRWMRLTLMAALGIREPESPSRP